MRHLLSCFAVFTSMCAATVCAQTDVNTELPWHLAALDRDGKLLAWHQPDKNRGYDQVLRLAWDFIEHKVPVDTKFGTGQKVYLIDSTYDGETLQGRNFNHNPAMVYACFVDGLIGWYPYSGDTNAIAAVREMLDYQLAHGTTPHDWNWPDVPFASSLAGDTNYGRCLAGMPRNFHGGLETDKVGQLGMGYVLFYELTGERKYLRAAIDCADALASHVRKGDEDHSPWPFRVDGRNGETLTEAEFGGDVASNLRLFDELIRIDKGSTSAYQKARDIAWQWELNTLLNPKSTAFNHWSGFFEDVAYNSKNVNQYLPTMVCYYIMSRPDPAAIDPQWQPHVRQMLDWVQNRFGRGPFFGAWGIDEQGAPDKKGCCSPAGLGSHTSRWAAVNAMFAELTGDARSREDAYRSLNYSTYFCDDAGKVSCCGSTYHNQYWFSDGYADYLRHFNWGMGALPELAPVGQNHILRSSSVVREVAYETKRIRYRTFDSDSTEILRINFEPARITAGWSKLDQRDDLKQSGYTLKPLAAGDFVLRIRHQHGKTVTIELPANQSPGTLATLENRPTPNPSIAR